MTLRFGKYVRVCSFSLLKLVITWFLIFWSYFFQQGTSSVSASASGRKKPTCFLNLFWGCPQDYATMTLYCTLENQVNFLVNFIFLYVSVCTSFTLSNGIFLSHFHVGTNNRIFPSVREQHCYFRNVRMLGKCWCISLCPSLQSLSQAREGFLDV